MEGGGSYSQEVVIIPLTLFLLKDGDPFDNGFGTGSHTDKIQA